MQQIQARGVENGCNWRFLEEQRLRFLKQLQTIGDIRGVSSICDQPIIFRIAPARPILSRVTAKQPQKRNRIGEIRDPSPERYGVAFLLLHFAYGMKLEELDLGLYAELALPHGLDRLG